MSVNNYYKSAIYNLDHITEMSKVKCRTNIRLL